MTTKKFSLLHISDLHIGQKNQWLWPNFKAIFLDDLRRLSEEAGPIDLVVFSGDLTQCGNKEQYDLLTNELKDIWEMWDKLNQRPLLFTVPGNHDLVRPTVKDPHMKLLIGWDNDKEVVREFWEDKDNPYIELIRSVFANYMSWQEEANHKGIPFATLKKGLLPGDASSSFEFNGISIGLIGLNSSFLQLNNGNFKEKLILDCRQINEVTNGNVPVWCDKHDTNFLITHHPVSWLSVEAQREFKTEIFPSGRFTAHLFGHMHEANLSMQYSGGDSGRKSLQSSSLFGMEYFDDGNIGRIHGYSIGQILFEGAEVKWRLWPRKGIVNKASGNRKIVPDHENFELVTGQEYLIEQLEKSSSMSKSLVMTPTPPLHDLAVAVEEGIPLWHDVLQSALYSVVVQEQHLEIRALEQQACIESMRHTRIAWVCADWGLGRDGFIWSVMKQENRDMQPIYRLALGSVDVLR